MPVKRRHYRIFLGLEEVSLNCGFCHSEPSAKTTETSAQKYEGKASYNTFADLIQQNLKATAPHGHKDAENPLKSKSKIIG